MREATSDDLDMILQWRNSLETRRVMFTDHEISKNEHLKWWSNVQNDKTKKVLLFVYDGKECGVINYFDIKQDGSSCHWGFYLSDKDFSAPVKMNIWLKLEGCAIEFAFEKIKVRNLICETFDFNKPVLAVHKRFGFKETGFEIYDKNNIKVRVVVTELNRDEYNK